MPVDLPRAAMAEFLGTAFLLAGVVGSGIMAQQLTTDVGLQLLANSTATVGVLVAVILTFAATSGAHFNPAVTLTEFALGELDPRRAVTYIGAQVTGGIVGVMAANIMFDLDAVNWSTKDRSSWNLWFAEGVATLGLLLVIFGIVRKGNPAMVAFAVGGYIGGAYWFTASTSFANPAVTIARTFSDTFAGIEPASAPMFIVSQLIATGIAIAIIRILWPKAKP
ncbi:MAG: glycerol uptake facilitator-like aquaporin [Verrucomicrobiales bacterium]|jgi:glycerol uptake facilitator-like aquaporin